MFVTKKRYDADMKTSETIINKLHDKKQDLLERNLNLELKVSHLEGRLLRMIDTKVSPHSDIDDNIAVYVEDIFVADKKVIKQEATLAVKVYPDGTVETGYTRQNADKGYNYKLVRI